MRDKVYGAVSSHTAHVAQWARMSVTPKAVHHPHSPTVSRADIQQQGARLPQGLLREGDFVTGQVFEAVVLLGGWGNSYVLQSEKVIQSAQDGLVLTTRPLLSKSPTEADRSCR